MAGTPCRLTNPQGVHSMKPRNLVVYAIAAATLSISTLSFAQGNPNGGRFEKPTLERVDDRRDDRPPWNAWTIG
eukprot:gene27831-49546_t